MTTQDCEPTQPCYSSLQRAIHSFPAIGVVRQMYQNIIRETNVCVLRRGYVGLGYDLHNDVRYSTRIMSRA